MKRDLYMLSLIIGLLLVFYGLASADPIEIWECKDTYQTWDKILVRAIVDEGQETGIIQVAGIEHKTQFQVLGFNRRWDFGLNNRKKTYDYAFVVEPDGFAKYFEFSSSSMAKPSSIMTCRQAKE